MSPEIDKLRELIGGASRVLVFTGAGISTGSGIPDFRGPSGIWTKDPEAEKRAYRVYAKFLKDPKEYWIERLTRPSLLGGTRGVSSGYPTGRTATSFRPSIPITVLISASLTRMPSAHTVPNPSA